MGAWFQVQVETITHPKTTRLRKTLRCSQCEATGIVIALLTWGVEHATKDGFFICEDEEDLGNYLRYVNAGTKLDPDDMVDGLKEAGWLDMANGHPRIHDWDIWQAALYKAKERRENDAARKREYRRNNRTAGKNEENTDAAEDGHADSPADGAEKQLEIGGEEAPAAGEAPAEPAPPAEPEPPKYAPTFDEFWDAYPKKAEKGNAYKKYQARINEGFSPEELLQAARNYAIQCKRLNTEKQYIKHPKTFLSDSRPFLDFLPEKKTVKETEEVPDSKNPFAEYGEE